MSHLGRDGGREELPAAKWDAALRNFGLTSWILPWLAAAAIIWVAYQIAYLACDFRSGPASDALVALHMPNFLIVAGTSSLLLTSWRRRYWRPIVFGAAFALSAWTLALCLLRGTPLPLLGTLVLMVLLPGALAPWRWYWTGAVC
jgi:hypothetical protein